MAFEPTWCATIHSRTKPSTRLSKIPAMTMTVEATTRRFTLNWLTELW